MFVLIFCLEFCWLHGQEIADLLEIKQVDQPPPKKMLNQHDKMLNKLDI